MSTYFLNSFPGLSRRDDKKIYTIENKKQQRKLEHGQDELVRIDGRRLDLRKVSFGDALPTAGT
jgi:hypothetical protein